MVLAVNTGCKVKFRQHKHLVKVRETMWLRASKNANWSMMGLKLQSPP